MDEPSELLPVILKLAKCNNTAGEGRYTEIQPQVDKSEE